VVPLIIPPRKEDRRIAKIVLTELDQTSALLYKTPVNFGILSTMLSRCAEQWRKVVEESTAEFKARDSRSSAPRAEIYNAQESK